MGCSCTKANTGQDIRDYYKMGDVLGTGSFGQVRACVKKSTSEVLAVKIMAKCPKDKKGNNVDFASMFRNEVNLLESLDHRNVVKYHELFEDKHFLYAVMDKCDGGELFTQIVKKRRFTEADAASLCQQMLDSIRYVHGAGIVHRDVKAENFLFSDRTDSSRLVLIDFGMSTRLVDENQYLRQLCGSPHYVAPELIRRNYRFKVDLWAMGVVIYLMLYGRYPFEGADQKAIVQQILKSEPDYNRGSSQPSPVAISFMKGLLAKDPEKRPTADEALQHPWVVPEHRRENSQYEISEELIKSAFRKASMERDIPPDEEIHKINRKLTEMDEQYIQGKAYGRRLSAGHD